ncbi:molecular chaperone [Rhodoferax sp.]|uniref:TorD/DmsD family molecular chaperone n=1 Tax=Rhodoferax sp. TaxID=50421 RepID=UPI0027578C9C|nr:molecular chaperone TorD family protein [Rhodocyclaceae bacterium]MDP2366900.1 molecular chaperone TorD family protein [Rhodoferax sp.]
MTETDLSASLAREDACRYLAACYYQPEAAFAEEKVFQSLLDAVALVDANLIPYARQLGAEFVRARTEDLLLDYTRLFLGPMQILAKPYGSVWLEESKTLMGDTTMAVIELYQEGGFEIDEEFRELPDHIAVELEFLYLLIFQENEARSSGNVERLNAVADLKARFLDQHLGRLVGPFTEAVKDSAESVFYRQLAELTALFVGRERAASALR